MLNNPLDFEKPLAEVDEDIAQLKLILNNPHGREDALTRGIDLEAEIAGFEQKREEMMRRIFANLSPWNEVQIARHPSRPYTLDFIKLICDDFMELHGDRINSDDAAIVGGLAHFRGEAVVVVGHQKGRDLKERSLRNFGSARPSGFRKALRLMQLAEKFNKPILVFVDTMAAMADPMAEEEGISRAIAVNLMEMVMLRVPIVVAVTGEGGSGGALGIAVGDRVVMLEHAVYSVIPPESCAAILTAFGRDKARAAEAADALKLTARNALELGVVDEMLPEPLGGAHHNPAETAAALKQAIGRHLTALGKLTPDELVQLRYQKYRNMGAWYDAAAILNEQLAVEPTSGT
jgi:acetyl-CoA carboxylase carboxyl transferase subunit alpha